MSKRFAKKKKAGCYVISIFEEAIILKPLNVFLHIDALKREKENMIVCVYLTIFLHHEHMLLVFFVGFTLLFSFINWLFEIINV